MDERLKKIIDNSASVVFFGAQAYQQKVTFLISAQKRVYIARSSNTDILQSKCYHILFS